jgi:hypothetical protein
MNNCYQMYGADTKTNPYRSKTIDEYKLLIDNNSNSEEDSFLYYECFTNNTNAFQYVKMKDANSRMYNFSKIISVRKSIPTVFHHCILYYYYIPNY